MNEKLFVACDSFITQKDVIEVSETVPAQRAPSEFKAYFRSLDETHAFSDGDSDYSELITNKFNDALCIVEKLGVKSSSMWNIISQYASLVQLIYRVISCLSSTEVSEEQMFSDLKFVLLENCASMGNNVQQCQLTMIEEWWGDSEFVMSIFLSSCSWNWFLG